MLVSAAGSGGDCMKIRAFKDQSDPDNIDSNIKPERHSSSRRKFLGNVGGMTAATVAVGAIGFSPLAGSKSTEAEGQVLIIGPDARRRQQSFQLRQQAAQNYKVGPPTLHPTNGDEQAFTNKIACYSKGLPHNSRGEVDLTAYAALTKAMTTEKPSDFEAIPMGAPLAQRRKLVNPQAGIAFDIEGIDSHEMAIPPAPAFSSAEEAAEIVENYWMALLRDVNFDDFPTSPLAQAAAAELTGLSGFKGPRIGGLVTANSLFRGLTAGDLIGPYISQFMLVPISFGAQFIDQREETYLPNIDYMTDFTSWLSVQNGFTQGSNQFDPVRRFIRNGRDISAYVHIDVLYQAYFNAGLVLFHANAPLNANNPYAGSQNQEGFATFGAPHAKTLIAEVATRALKAVWYQKWFVHRRLRPEAFGGAVHNVKTNTASYPIHSSVLNSQAIQEVHSRYNTYLLPMAFPEGSPLHPAYGAGHATVAGGCVTLLKAFFNGATKIVDLFQPVVTSPDGQTLVPYGGADVSNMTVEGELNKLAANIAIGRNHAGVHWRSDYTQSLLLGEAVAISILKDQRACYTESFAGFTFNKFDGTQVTI